MHMPGVPPFSMDRMTGHIEQPEVRQLTEKEIKRKISGYMAITAAVVIGIAEIIKGCQEDHHQPEPAMVVPGAPENSTSTDIIQ